MKNATSLMKIISKGLVVGGFIALLISMIGVSVILVYGLANAPQNIHVSLLSQQILDFTSTQSTFQVNMYPQGMLVLIMILMLIGAVLFWIFRKVFRPAPSLNPGQ